MNERSIDREDIHGWIGDADRLSVLVDGMGLTRLDPARLEEHGVPLHLQFAVRGLVGEHPDATIDALSSISFYSLCRGFFLPVSGLAPDRTAYLFGFRAEPTPGGREALVAGLFEKPIGLGFEQRLACVLGDPFRGRPGTFRRESLVRLYLSMRMIGRRQVLDELARHGDIATLFALGRPARVTPALTAAEVLESLRFLPDAAHLEADAGVDRRWDRFAILRSLLDRCSALEAFFLIKLVLRKAGFGFEYEGELVSRVLAKRFACEPELVSHAIALTDAFQVVRALAEGGPAALRKIQLRPLVAVRPALAGGTANQIDRWPVWVERKYDGIRFLLHKSTDASGAVLCAAYTRNRRDWLELVPGLDATIRALPARAAIVDGELYGTVIDADGARPADVYEVYQALQGDRRRPVQLRFAAFDLLYVDGHDLTSMPLMDRRQRLQAVVDYPSRMPLGVPIALADGQLAQGPEDVSRLYQHFRAQRYEGIIAKDPRGTYHLADRDPTWWKRKPEETLDLALLAGVFAVTEKRTAGLFGSYVLGALRPDGSFEDVGDVAGVDVERDREIQGTIVREGLLTGHRIERPSASGTRPGVDLRPHIVVTVKFEGIVKDPQTGAFKMRDPKLVAIRSDKAARECDSLRGLEEVYLRHRMA